MLEPQSHRYHENTCRTVNALLDPIYPVLLSEILSYSARCVLIQVPHKYCLNNDVISS